MQCVQRDILNTKVKPKSRELYISQILGPNFSRCLVKRDHGNRQELPKVLFYSVSVPTIVRILLCTPIMYSKE